MTIKTKLFLLFFVLILSVIHSKFVSAEIDIAAKVLPVVCDIVAVLKSVATGIAALVMVLAGIKWTASENDPGARKAAKDTMIHAIVGLIIVIIVAAVLNIFAGIRTFGVTLGNPCP